MPEIMTKDTLEPIELLGTTYSPCAGVIDIPHPADTEAKYQVHLVTQKEPGGKELKRRDWRYDVNLFKRGILYGTFTYASYEDLMYGLNFLVTHYPSILNRPLPVKNSTREEVS